MSRADFLEGLKGGIPVGLAAAPFGALFGALARDQGMSLGELTLMSGTVYAGASQMVGLDLFGHNVQAWLIVLSPIRGKIHRSWPRCAVTTRRWKCVVASWMSNSSAVPTSST